MQRLYYFRGGKKKWATDVVTGNIGAHETPVGTYNLNRNYFGYHTYLEGNNDDGSRYMVLFYKTNKFEGELSSSDEGEVRWMDLEEMKKANLAEGMDKMLEVFLDENISEYYFYKENGEWQEVLK